jgi:hypothetical protein
MTNFDPKKRMNPIELIEELIKIKHILLNPMA